MNTNTPVKKNHILDIAEQLFADYGFDGTSTRMLSKEAAVNLGMLSYYFGTKEKILEALIERKQISYKHNLEPLRPFVKTHMNMMEAVIDVYIDHIVDNAKFHKIIQNEVFNEKIVTITKFTFNIIKQNFDYINSIILDGIKEKEFRDVDAPLFVISLIGTLIQFIRSETLTQQLLSKNKSKSTTQETLHKERLRIFMKDYLHIYLTIQN